MLSNGGFEIGPGFLKNSPNGIILHHEERLDTTHSPLQQWSIHGTIRYIDSSHYKVPQGKAAVELLSGGVREESMNLRMANTYTLNFTIGDANDSCVADFVVYVQAGSSVYNYTMRSNGRGSTFKHTLKFRVDEVNPWEPSTISFYSYEETRTKDGVLCGPVLDDILLASSDSDSHSDSYGERVQVCNIGVLVVSLVIAFVLMVI